MTFQILKGLANRFFSDKDHHVESRLDRSEPQADGLTNLAAQPISNNRSFGDLRSNDNRKPRYRKPVWTDL